MAADDKFSSKKSYKTISEYGQGQDVTETKNAGTFWLRIYNCKGVKLPYDQALDTMPMLRGNSQFAQDSNKFAATLLKQVEANLLPGEEKTLKLEVRIYRKKDTSNEVIDDDDDEMYI